MSPEPLERESERGAVLVIFAVFAPVLIVFFIFVIDVDNWLEHKRHLQVQADAGALAAAQHLQPCDDSKVYGAAGQYSGASSVGGPGGSVTSGSPLYNNQVGGTAASNIHELINSKTFYNQPSTASPETPDDTVTSGPCTARMIDVKMTETSLPWYFRAFTSVPYIDAEARVSRSEERRVG